MNLTDLLTQQNNGVAVQQLSQQFGLNQEQTVQAIEALMPAFSQGLKRNTQQPQGAAALIEALAHGQHGRYIDTPEYATASAGVGDGNAILGHLFGNKDVSRAVANHASATTGIGSSILKKMLPVIASMVMGSLFKGATGSSRSSGGGLGGVLGQAAGGGILGQIIEGLAGGALGGSATGGSQQRRAPRTRRSSPSPTGGTLEDLLGQMMGGGRKTAPRRRSTEPVMPSPRRSQPQSGGTGGGLADIFDQLAGAGGQSGRRTNPYAPKPSRRTQRRQPGGLGEIFGDMFEPGGNTAPEYQQQTGSVFDEFLGPSR